MSKERLRSSGKNRVEALARATLAHGLLQSAIHFPRVAEAMGLNESEALQHALSLAEEAIALAPELPDGHCALARVLMCSDHPEAADDARAVLEHVLDLDPEHDPAHVALAVLEREAGALDAALDRLDAVVKAGNGHPLTFLLRGAIHAQRGDRARARIDFSLVMKHAPESGLVDLELAEAKVWSDGEYAEIRARAEARLGRRFEWAQATLASRRQ